MAEQSLLEPVYSLPIRQDELLAHQVEAEFARLRKIGPVVRAKFPFGGDGWAVVGFNEVKTVLRDPRFSVQQATRKAYPRIRVSEAAPPMDKSFISLDPPEHSRRRTLLMKHLTPRRIQSLLPQIDALIAECLDNVEKSGAPVDLAHEFTQAVPIGVLSLILGAPREENHLFLEPAHDISNSRVTTPEEGQAKLDQILAYFTDLTERKRHNPGDDLLSALLQDAEAESGMGADELNGLGMVMLLAGHDATSAILGGALRWLAHDLETRDILVKEPHRIGKAVEEFIRFLPAGLAGTRTRVAMEDIELGGVLIRADDAVLPIVHSANFDEGAFAHGDAFDISREGPNHVGFGFGIHNCVGAQIARTQIELAIRRLLERFPNMRAADPRPDWREHILLRGPKSIKIIW